MLITEDEGPELLKVKCKSIFVELRWRFVRSVTLKELGDVARVDWRLLCVGFIDAEECSCPKKICNLFVNTAVMPTVLL